MIDKDFSSRLDNLKDLNGALSKLNPKIDNLSKADFSLPFVSDAMLNKAIADCKDGLYDGIQREDILEPLNKALQDLINTQEASAYTYDTHGDKHFPGGPQGTKFNKPKTTVNPKLVALIKPEIGRIRRDAKGKDQTYYLTATRGITECGGKPLTIQVDYDFSKDSITYHGYPDDGVTKNSLSRSKGGPAIAD
jgi:hypothetical protein